MTQLADSAALIIDLRRNGGGDPTMVALIAGYLFEKRTHLNDLYWREGQRIEEFWTDENVAGPQYGIKKAIYVLTSKLTFSAAEEFAYDLKALKRATIIGEITGGGANPGGDRRLSANFSAFIPNGRAINPITKSNWEGTGVVPDVLVPSSNALLVAQTVALKALSQGEKDPQKLQILQEQQAELKGQMALSASSLFGRQPIYLQGTMNTWGIRDELCPVNATSYGVDIALPPGLYEFKVGSRDFETIDYGANDNLRTYPWHGNTVMKQGGKNMLLEISRAGVFTFKFDVKNPKRPAISVVERTVPSGGSGQAAAGCR